MLHDLAHHQPSSSSRLHVTREMYVHIEQHPVVRTLFVQDFMLLAYCEIKDEHRNLQLLTQLLHSEGGTQWIPTILFTWQCHGLGTYLRLMLELIWAKECVI